MNDDDLIPEFSPVEDADINKKEFFHEAEEMPDDSYQIMNNISERQEDSAYDYQKDEPYDSALSSPIRVDRFSRIASSDSFQTPKVQMRRNQNKTRPRAHTLTPGLPSDPNFAARLRSEKEEEELLTAAVSKCQAIIDDNSHLHSYNLKYRFPFFGIATVLMVLLLTCK